MLRRVGTEVKLRSGLFIPTTRETPRQATAVSHDLLTRAGYIQQSASGIYRYLPLADRVLDKLCRVIDAELQRDPLNANKLRLPLLSPAELWKSSGRWDVYGDELMRLKDRKEAEFCLGPTFEEEISQVVGSTGIRSSKELPLKLYQITHKYRDEVRPRFGLLRGREFVMKDLYTFHTNAECARETYDQVCEAYCRIFNTLGLDFVKVLADSGAMGGNYTHEFQMLADIGEDDLLYCDKGDYRANAETVFGEEPVPENPLLQCTDPSCSCANQSERGSLHVKKGIEVGQAFILGTKYAEMFQALFRDVNGGKPQVMQMGCYGIGVSRVMAAVIDGAKGNDSDGIIWPRIIAPFDAVVLTGPGNKSAREEYEAIARRLVSYLVGKNVNAEIVLDDRWNESFGKKLAEAKLLGFPYIFVVGRDSLESDMSVEMIERKQPLLSTIVSFDKVAEILNHQE